MSKPLNPAKRFNIERDIFRPALEMAAAGEHAPDCLVRPCNIKQVCTCYVGAAKLALSFYLENGIVHGPVTDEIRAVLGEHWVIARPSPRIFRQYGEDVKCLTPMQYEEGQRQAVALRASCLGVALQAVAGALKFGRA